MKRIRVMLCFGLFDSQGRTTERMKIYDDFWNEIKSESK